MTNLHPLVKCAAIASLCLVTGCGGLDYVRPAGATASPVATPTVAPSAVLDHGDAEGPASEPQWTDSARAGALDLAEHGVAAWINTSRGEDVWRAGLVSWFPPDAQSYYASVDPRNIAAGTVITGRSVLADEGSAYLAEVIVETTSGRYHAVLNRASGDEPWALQRITQEEK